MAAGIATLDGLRRLDPYAELDRVGGLLQAGLLALTKELGVPAVVNRCGSMWTLFFTPNPVTGYESAKSADTARFGRFFWAMMDRGFYLPCSQFEAAFSSVLHTEERIRETLAAAREALKEIKE